MDIIDKLSTYPSLNNGWRKIIEFFLGQNFDLLFVGEHEIEGRYAFLIVSENSGRRKKDAQLEAHEQYTHIQIVLGGSDFTGWECVNHYGKLYAE